MTEKKQIFGFEHFENIIWHGVGNIIKSKQFFENQGCGYCTVVNVARSETPGKSVVSRPVIEQEA